MCVVYYPSLSASIINLLSINCRETLLQAIGMIINTVGEKVKETVVDDLRETLVTLLQTLQVSILQ